VTVRLDPLARFSIRHRRVLVTAWLDRILPQADIEGGGFYEDR